MTLTQLRYAITVASTKSMNEAARKLFISQPSLSQAINAPNKMSVIPSNNFDTIISVPTIPVLSPTVSDKKIITNEDKNAYTTFPAISPNSLYVGSFHVNF